MTYHVPYSASQPGTFTHVPGSYVSQVMRQVGDNVELKVSLLAFYLLSRSREYPGYIMHSDLVLKAAALLGVDEARCTAGMDAAVERGVFLEVQSGPGADVAYFANLEDDVEAVERLRESWVSDGSVSRPLNIFELYEQNIGIISPMMAEELKDAQRAYPVEWIEQAFREAVIARKQNWKYVSRILERWTVEGRGSGAHRSGALPDGPDKYVKGRFGGIVRR